MRINKAKKDQNRRHLQYILITIKSIKWNFYFNYNFNSILIIYITVHCLKSRSAKPPFPSQHLTQPTSDPSLTIMWSLWTSNIFISFNPPPPSPHPKQSRPSIETNHYLKTTQTTNLSTSCGHMVLGSHCTHFPDTFHTMAPDQQ